MRTMNLSSVVIIPCISLLSCTLGCGGMPSADSSASFLDQLIDPSRASAVDNANDNAAGEDEQQNANESATSQPADPAAAAAAQTQALIKEIQDLLAGQDAGASSAALNDLLAKLVATAGGTIAGGGAQIDQVLNPFERLRTTIHTLRHTLTRKQAAGLFLSAVVQSQASGAAAAGDSTLADVLAQVQAILGVLNP